MSDMDAQKQRYRALDILRGLSILLMIAHHLSIDLINFGIVPAWLLDNPIVQILQPLFASCFVALSGASSRFSKSNLSRGLKILLCAALVTLATWAGGMLFDNDGYTVRFGILHFLGCASIIYHFLRPALDKLRIPPWVWLFLYLGSSFVFPIHSDIGWLWPLGVMQAGFMSADYYPIFPWIFMYFFGLWVADTARAGRFPPAFYSARCTFLEAVSRHSLVIYLVHQPLFMAVFYAIFYLFAR